MQSSAKSEEVIETAFLHAVLFFNHHTNGGMDQSIGYVHRSLTELVMPGPRALAPVVYLVLQGPRTVRRRGL